MTTEQLVRAGLPMLDRLVCIFLAKRPAHIDRDAVRGAAHEALVRAAASYDPARGVPFDAWAYQRIQGAMRDETRTRAIQPVTLVPLEERDAIAADPADRTAATLDLRAALHALEPRTRQVIVQLAAGYTLREIGAELGVTEARACQLSRLGARACQDRMAA